MTYFPLSSRQVIQICGNDRKVFLQGLITQDIHTLSSDNALFGAFLTPQGRIKSTFFIFEQNENLFLDLPAERSKAILKYLEKSSLRNQVRFSASDLQIFAGSSNSSRPDNLEIITEDPRLLGIGWRGIGKKEDSTAQDRSFFKYQKKYGLLDDSNISLLREKIFPTEFNLDLLNAIAWNKGCYVGQEVTARFHHRNLTKRRVFSVAFLESAAHHKLKECLFSDTVFYAKNGEKAGNIIYSDDEENLFALVERKYWHRNEQFFLSDIPLQCIYPAWLPNFKEES